MVERSFLVLVHSTHVLGYPDCDGARKPDGSEVEPPKTLGKPCPKCKKGELMERDGRYGQFIMFDISKM